MSTTDEGRLRVGFAGEPGSFAEDAALSYFGVPECLPMPTFRDVVEAVAGRRADAGVVPIENVVNGTVREVYDLLLDADVALAGEVIVPVRLCLAALPGERLDSIERVYSHIQALGQAEAFLASRPWTLLATTNTAGAGKAIAERAERGAAAVLSPRAASLHGLSILASDIQTEPANRTRFLILRSGPTAPSGGPPADIRSTLVVGVRNEPGSLHRMLGVLAANGVNLSKLESRPSRVRAWEYVFWVDIDGDLCAPGSAAVLAELRGVTSMLRVMGCYPRAPEPA